MNRRRASRPPRALVPSLLGSPALLLVGCAGGQEGDDQAAGFTDPGMGHVHGVGVDPTSGDVLAATHNGLLRLGEDEPPVRVADRWQDTTGFTVDADRLPGSGHADLREDLPAHLGLIESTDSGQTWTSVSLLGEAGVHALTVEGSDVFGWDSVSGAVLASDDDGRSWQQPGERHQGGPWREPSVVLSLDGAPERSRPDGMATVVGVERVGRGLGHHRVPAFTPELVVEGHDDHACVLGGDADDAGRLRGVRFPAPVHEVGNVRDERPLRQTGDETVHVPREPFTLVADHVVTADGHRDEVGVPVGQLGQLLVHDVRDFRAGDAEVDDQHRLSGGFTELCSQLTDVPVLRCGGPDTLRGGVAEGDVDQAPGVPAGLGPVQAGSVDALLHLHQADQPHGQGHRGQSRQDSKHRVPPHPPLAAGPVGPWTGHPLDGAAVRAGAARGSSRPCSFTRRSSCAFRATTTVEALIRTAPRAMGRTNPTGARTPAASGMATML